MTTEILELQKEQITSLTTNILLENYFLTDFPNFLQELEKDAYLENPLNVAKIKLCREVIGLVELDKDLLDRFLELLNKMYALPQIVANLVLIRQTYQDLSNDSKH